MRIILFTPSYNDTFSAYRIAKKFLKNEHVKKALIIDDSDDPENISFSKSIKDKDIQVINRKRSGKWSAWRLALELSREYDGLIEVDADVEVANPDVLVSHLNDHDVVTAYQDIIPPPGNAFFSGRIIDVYQEMHQKMKEIGKFNMGGQIIALSRKSIIKLLENDFFKEPVISDDHVICLASYALKLKCKSVDCGLRIKLPSTITDWIKYRSRHRGAIRRAEEYVAVKIGYRKRIKEISMIDYNTTKICFLRTLFDSFNPINLCIFLFFGLTSYLPIEDQVEWSVLESTKIRQLINTIINSLLPNILD